MHSCIDLMALEAKALDVVKEAFKVVDGLQFKEGT
jgi:hypothetical protein